MNTIQAQGSHGSLIRSIQERPERALELLLLTRSHDSLAKLFGAARETPLGMLTAMKAGVSWNCLMGSWCAHTVFPPSYQGKETLHAYGQTPEDAIGKLYVMWVADGSHSSRVITQDELDASI